MKKFLAMMLALIMVLSLAACGNQAAPDANTDDNSDTSAEVTYAVEAGSAGEEVANEKGWKINSVASQADALMEVDAGTSDAAIIDLLMAGAMEADLRAVRRRLPQGQRSGLLHQQRDVRGLCRW